MAPRNAPAKQKEESIDREAKLIEARGPSKMRKLIIRNFCCIGDQPVEIDLDRIVVLVGPNDAGKSTILAAYEKITSDKKPTLSPDEFHCGTISPDKPAIIELHTAFPNNVAADRWVDVIDGENIVRERWVWISEGVGKREGYDVDEGWVDARPWGADNVAKFYRPTPHRVEAFDNPDAQAQKVADLLLAGITAELKQPLKKSETGEETAYGKLISQLADLQKSVVANAQAKIDAAEEALGKFVGDVFQGYKVKFDARPEDNLDKALTFFKAGAQLTMGPDEGHMAPIQRQGSGARRTLLWAALRYLAEHITDKTQTSHNLLLLDEPELCLHPSAIREACRTLYALADEANWQIMITTHSPAFIDLSRDNTTVVRIERQAGGVKGITVFRPEKVKLDPDEKAELKLLNLFDPHVAEFLFGGRTILVEGDTEYTAFRYVITEFPEEEAFKGLHVIRARGKIQVALMAKILNHFGAQYGILHDSDTPERFEKGKVVLKKDGTPAVNQAWSNNSKILKEYNAALDKSRVRLIANLPHFEGAIFGGESKSDKPYTALEVLRSDTTAKERVRDLLKALVDFTAPLPATCCQWTDLPMLQASLQNLSALAAPVAVAAEQATKGQPLNTIPSVAPNQAAASRKADTSIQGDFFSAFPSQADDQEHQNSSGS